MKSWFKNIKLKGEKIELIPLRKSHKTGLLNAAADGKLWGLWFTSFPSSENIDNYINSA